MTMTQLRSIVCKQFPGAEYTRYRYNVHIVPAETVTYQKLNQIAYEIEQSGGGNPRIDLGTTPGECGGSEVTPPDSDRVALWIWMEVTP